MNKQERDKIREEINDWSLDSSIFREYCEKLLDALLVAETKAESYSDVLCTTEYYVEELKQKLKEAEEVIRFYANHSFTDRPWINEAAQAWIKGNE